MPNQLNENSRLDVKLLEHFDGIKSIVGRESMDTLDKDSDVLNLLVRCKSGEYSANHGFEREGSKFGDETFTAVLVRLNCME